MSQETQSLGSISPTLNNKASSESLNSTGKSNNTSTSNITSKSSKQRKVQLEEQFLEQKAKWDAEGPIIQTPDGLINRDFTDAKAKIDRVALRNAVERCLYIGKYDRGLEILDQGMDNTSNSREEAELQYLREALNKAKDSQK